MKTHTKSTWLSITSLLLTLPAAWLICISLMKYVFGVNGPFDASQPFLEKWGIRETIGWNVNLLIFFGPIIGLLLSVFQVLKLNWEFTKEQFKVQIAVKKRWFPILVAGFCIGLLAILFVYMLGENCNC